MKTLEILCGIPCSGKSTYTEHAHRHGKHVQSVSRDELREVMYGKKYKFSKQKEDNITEVFDRCVNNSLDNKYIERVILDNTHCKEGYIDSIIKKYPQHTIKIKFFEISLLKAHYRNIIRYFNTGKWIPIKVMNTMYRNYNKINKKKYEKYYI